MSESSATCGLPAGCTIKRFDMLQLARPIFHHFEDRLRPEKFEAVHLILLHAELLEHRFGFLIGCPLAIALLAGHQLQAGDRLARQEFELDACANCFDPVFDDFKRFELCA